MSELLLIDSKSESKTSDSSSYLFNVGGFANYCVTESYRMNLKKTVVCVCVCVFQCVWMDRSATDSVSVPQRRPNSGN